MIINPKISQSPTLVFAEAARKRRNEGKDIVSMGIGEPDITTPQFLVDAVVKSAKNTGINGYLNALGLNGLREKISDDLRKRKKFDFATNQIMVTAGAKQAIQLILSALLKPEDEVVYFTPCYVSYLPQIFLSEPKAIPVPVSLDKENFDIDFEKFESKITSKTKVILLNSPHNPTGKIFPKKDLEKIASIALKHNIYVVLDDVYELLIYDNKDVFSLGTLPELKELLFFVNSFSKSHAVPGWRIGYLCAPLKEMPNLIKIQQHMNTNTNSLVQYASESIFENGFDFLKDYNITLKKRADFIRKELSDITGTNVFMPQGGFFFFFNISKFSNDSNQFCAGLIDEVGVAVTPGIAFGEDWNEYVRMSFGLDDDTIKEGLKRIRKYVNA